MTSKTKRGPSRIRISFSREFSTAEQEWFRSGQGGVTFEVPKREVEVAGLRLTLSAKQVTARLNGNQKLWLESSTYSSRELFDFGKELVESTFVNVFPTAVRTFRELS